MDFFFRMNLSPNAALREELAISNQLQHFRDVVAKMKAKYEPYHEGEQLYEREEVDPSVLAEDEGVSLL